MAEALQPVSEHQKTPMPRSQQQQQQYPYEQSCSSISRTLSWSSNKSLSSTAPLGDIPVREAMYTSTPVSSRTTNDKTTPVTFMMRPDADYTPNSGFNQTCVSREEYVKWKRDADQEANVHIVVYPSKHLEMQRFPNKVFHYLYETGNNAKEDAAVQIGTPRKDHCSAAKEAIVTQSPEDTSRAVSVLNVMLQRRLNGSGNHNGPTTKERSNGLCLTPTAPPSSQSTQRVLYLRTSPVRFI
ncbi:unnamed protein product [Gongylonema pulchrum]|uniref:Tyrosine-protein phosphatase domain-containing protein n=1 Tax=Gongylonema pulchrum TaxID=637853 RepID=A0A183EFC7_9BILA|nr:unnamed protein product [Gongylonema pulchrum]